MRATKKNDKNEWDPVRPCDGCGTFRYCTKVETPGYFIFYLCAHCLSEYASKVRQYEREHAYELLTEALAEDRLLQDWADRE